MIDRVTRVANRITEVAHHVANWERWMGASASPVGEEIVADPDSIDPFALVSGDDYYGDWTQILGSSDTPVQGDIYKKFSVNGILLAEAEEYAIVTRLQFAFGESGSAALSAGTYTDIALVPAKDAHQYPCPVMTEHSAVGTLYWARCWVAGKIGKSAKVLYSILEYEG